MLEGPQVVRLKTPRDVFALPRRSGGRTVVMIDTYGWLGLVGVLASLYLRVPLVVRLRGHPFRENRERLAGRSGLRPWARFLAVSAMQLFCLFSARLVLFNSSTVARELASVVPERRRAVVHNPYTEPGTNLDGPSTGSRFPEGGLRLLTVTSMNLASKVDPTLEAAGHLARMGLWDELDLRWVVCGAGRHEERVREAARRLGIEGRLVAPGRVEDIGSAYEWGDVLVYLTRLDAFPNVPMEAMMRQKPVITNADSHGTREQVFDGVNGVVVEDLDELAAALRAYAGNAALRERHGRAGRELVEQRFSVDAQRRAMGEALEKLYVPRKGRR
ncbi:glycosyltransferase family 4 protein [Rubrobacter marinus]|uniref:glycosyltransferase family 4 protein n=1 Tax=Rubrobacter marinus TaxID=2653852 RepID=UPI00140B055A|nr:glycosyltransferase family 4 protein [Rubrobacter marinus]